MNLGMLFFTGIFVCMLALPLIVAAIYFLRKKGEVLNIRQDYIKDARYFGRSFAKLMEKILPNMKDGTIELSKPEKVLEVAGNQIFKDTKINKLLVSRKEPFCPKQDGLIFEKEIYSETDVILGVEETRLRAVYSKSRILLGNKTQLLRWADAEKAIAVYDNCNLGRSVSSAEQLVIGFNTTFHRLYAPKIRLGQRPEDADHFMDERDVKIFRMPVSNDMKFNIHYVDDDMTTENGTVPYTIISKGNVKVIEDIILQGDIHSDSSVRIMENAVVLGNIFAEKEILVEKNATVLGNVFTQGNIVLEKGASVGQPNKISSVIAREKITFHGNNYVFGYIASESGCEILAAEEENFKKYCFPKEPIYEERLIFKDLEEYQNVDSQGFRLDCHIKEAVIPEGAVSIPQSQFFGCRSLEKIWLPTSISVIEDYAFADCSLLRMQEDISKLALKHIGISAFENCRALELEGFADSLEAVEGAAFAGCISIKKLILSKGASLKKIGDHAFRDCKSLKEIYLPDRLEYVGISAFYGCDVLERISVPYGVKDQPGITELKEICPKCKLHFREQSAQKADSPSQEAIL